MRIETFVDQIILDKDSNAWIGKLTFVTKSEKEYQVQADYGMMDNAPITRVSMVYAENNAQAAGTYMLAEEKKYRGDIISGLTNMAQYLIATAKNSSDPKVDKYWQNKAREDQAKYEQALRGEN